MKITKELLRKWDACTEGYKWFIQKFPLGAPVQEVVAELRLDSRGDDERWLFDRLFDRCLTEPEPETESIEELVLMTLESASGDSSRLAASGHCSRLAASGNYSRLAASGDSSQLAASGDSSRLAASGNCSQLAASGDSSRLAASGKNSIAMAAGLNSRASAGEGGAFALAWMDQDRVRIAVGIVGEGGIKPNTMYKVDSQGNLVECSKNL